MPDNISRKKFNEIRVEDPFFDSLRDDYHEFNAWFRKKADEECYVFYQDGKINGIMYLKVEEGEVLDIEPKLPAGKRIKIGTFKIQAHGTKLGERFLKKALDYALATGANELYLTIFPKHSFLIDLFIRYGFIEYGTKIPPSGAENVFVKTLDKSRMTGNPFHDYPLLRSGGQNQFVLAIYPKWHTTLFPDSMLNSETYDVLHDVSPTNSISKMYICRMDLSPLRPGDNLIIYRTKDDKGPGEYRSVATSVCTVVDCRSKNDFSGINEYLTYCGSLSVFTEEELRQYHTWERLYVVKMLYNAAMSKRLIRKDLIEKVGLDRDIRWGFFHISRDQFCHILKLGGVDERIIID